MLIYILLAVGMICRFIIHMPNFTPIIAIALFSGLYVNKKWAILVPVALMVVTDMFIGFHNTMFFTWGSIAVIALANMRLRGKKNVKTMILSSLGSAAFFFIVTNFGVWLLYGTYTHDLAGIVNCYTMAIPFFRMTLLSTVVYAVIFYGVYETAALKLRDTKLAYLI